MSFNILGNGLTGLQASQQALNVISQNIANASTPGYVRQRAILESQQTAPSVNVYTGNSAQFMGVKVTGVERISSAFKQAALNSAVGRQEALSAQAAPLDNVQGQLQEPGTTGLQSLMTQFYQGWTDLGNNPVKGTSDGGVAINGAAAGVVIQQGVTLAGKLNSLSDGVASEYLNQFANLTGIVEQVNAQTQKVAALNQQIMQGTAGNNNVNALLDQRDSAITEIVKLTGATATSLDNGSVQVSVSGVTVVSGNAFNLMSVSGSSSIEEAGGVNAPGLLVGTVKASPAGGQAAGVLSALNTDLPAISASLDTVANGIRDAVNSVHSAGYTLDGTPGGDFFTGEGAQELTVAVTSPDELAISNVAGVSADGSNAGKIGDLVNPSVISAVLGGATAPQSVYSGMVTQIGTQLQGLNTAIDSQSGIVATAQSAVDSESGVDLNEELTNMILFQRSFQANSRVISAANEMLQSLIGMV
ncbi:flagellar hook-associated protein FlgK [Kineosporia sp. NBRC 101731]|uniref:flagellar hook-associated protein FlgK n=1 Tax=Kineosporia sp. NBRC 101731 TaxID=3032199 RepID=UPI0024A56522|nr:flagellar hook-associated protein FlgK [Kineosporia sp. NBRC 101731]GLY27027.1 flagellar hook-associated protein 1 [Kineosporia sp. NBRC 101731]